MRAPRDAARESRATRSLISFAALFVNVTARIDSAGSPCSTSHAIRWAMTLVFPEPAPARTSSGPEGHVTASRCGGFSERRSITGAGSCHGTQTHFKALTVGRILERGGPGASRAAEKLEFPMFWLEP